MRYAIAIATLLLAGCVSPQERAAQQQQSVDNYWQGIRNQCARIGYTPDTDAFRGCMMQAHQAEQQRRAAIGAALIGSGALNQRPQPVYQIPRQRTTNCYTDQLGYTNCTTR